MIRSLQAWAARHGLPWIPVALGPTLLFGPALLHGRAFFWGTPLLQFIPWRTYARQLVMQGQLPLWNPALGMGAPLLANYQSALLYPPNWMLLVLDVAWGQTLLAMLHLIFAAAGMAVLARRLGMNPLAQTVSALGFGLSGYLVARAGFLTINAVSAWLPWIVCAVDRLAVGTPGPPPASSAERPASGAGPPQQRTGRTWWRSVGLLAIALAMQWLAGHAQLAWYSLLLAAAWLVVRAISTHGWRGLRLPAAGFALAGTLALLIASAQLLPTAEYLSVSDRSSGVEPEFAMTYSFWPWRVIGLIAPDIFGHPRDGTYWGYGNYWEDALYVGLLPFLLAISAVVRRRVHPLRWFLLAAGTSAFLLALGSNSPLFPWLFQHVPTFALFQAPTRWNLVLMFALALLAGFGVQRWGVASGRRLYWLRLGTAGAAAVVATAIAARALLSGDQLTFAPALAQGGVLMLASGALALARREGNAPWWQALVVGLVLADLLYAARGANPSLPIEFFRPRRLELPAGSAAPRLYMPRELERRLKFELAFRFDDFQAGQDWSFVREAALPNTGLLDGLHSANNFDPILPARYSAWIEALEDSASVQPAAVYRHMGVGQVADPKATYQPVGDARRAWLVPAAIWVPDAATAIATVFSDRFELDQRVVLEGDARAELHGEPGSASVRLEQPRAGRVDLQVQTEAGGWLVLADSWYPGWQAYLDGQPVESYPANGAFRASWVPEGTHAVSYRYEPLSVRWGFALSGLGLILLAWVLRR